MYYYVFGAKATSTTRVRVRVTTISPSELLCYHDLAHIPVRESGARGSGVREEDNNDNNNSNTIIMIIILIIIQ